MFSLIYGLIRSAFFYWSLLLPCFVSGFKFEDLILTTKPPSAVFTFAKGYPNFEMKVTFKKNPVNTTCEWRVAGKAYKFLKGLQCLPTINNNKERVTCSVDGTNYTSTFVMKQPLNTTFDIGIACDTSFASLSSIFVRACNRKLKFDLSVEANSYEYKSKGTYKCDHGTPFSNNALSKTTVCEASAKWTDQEITDCSSDLHQKKRTSCTWYIDEVGKCDVKFTADPVPKFVALTKDGKNVRNEGSNHISSFHHFRTLEFLIKKVSLHDQGKYSLTLNSVYPAKNNTLDFDILTIKRPPVPSNSNGGAVAGVLITIIVAVVITGYILRKKTASHRGASVLEEELEHEEHAL